MYEQRDNYNAKPSTLPMYPRRPDVDDDRWRDVVVRRRTRNETSVLRFPIEADDIAIMPVYAGDTIAIIPEIQFEYYVAARIGYHVGWINFKHVKLLSLKPGRKSAYLEDTRPDVPPDRDERIQQHRDMQRRAYIAQPDYADDGHDEYTEEETQPAPVERKPPPIPKKDVHRIIDKLKSLGGLFSRR